MAVDADAVHLALVCGQGVGHAQDIVFRLDPDGFRIHPVGFRSRKIAPVVLDSHAGRSTCETHDAPGSLGGVPAEPAIPVHERGDVEYVVHGQHFPADIGWSRVCFDEL